MPSLVPDFLLHPVLRQARLFSSNFSASETAAPPQDEARPPPAPHRQDEAPALTPKTETERETTQPEKTVCRLSGAATMLPVESGPAEVPAVSMPPQPRGPRALPPLATAAVGSGDSSSTELADLQSPLFSSSGELPEDDGMGALRQRILAIQSRNVAPPEKARMMHGLLMEGYTRARETHLPVRPLAPTSPTVEATICAPLAHTGPLESFKFWHAPTATQTFTLTEEDLRPTYVPRSGASVGGRRSRAPSLVDEGSGEDEERFLGCAHYRRNVKMQCFTCERWYTCRLCHDEVEDHVLPRRNTRFMLCMLCGHAQNAGDVCHKCGVSAAKYYCGICKLWDGAPDKSIYHCNDCGLCRVGEGLGKDFFHCKKCGSCIAITQEDSHRCLEGVMDCDCPICGEYMFTSYKKVVTMKCGHTIHDDCRAEYIKRSYKCPICNKSVENMESLFRRLDKHLEEQPMPAEYEHTRAIILCNDCEAKTTTKYHWGGLRCEVCLSYNTVELHLLNSPTSHGEATAGEAAGEQHVASLDDANRGTAHEGVSGDGGTLLRPAAVPIRQSTLQSYLSPPSPLSSSPASGEVFGRSPPALFFRSVSPADMGPAPVVPIALPPPGYGRDGFQPEDDDGSDEEDEDILGLWRPHRRSVASHGGQTDSDSDDDDESDVDEDDDYDEDDDDEEEEISLFGHP